MKKILTISLVLSMLLGLTSINRTVVYKNHQCSLQYTSTKMYRTYIGNVKGETIPVYIEIACK